MKTQPDFETWMKNMGIETTNQPEYTRGILMVFERMYDLILDTRQQVKEMEK
jgi:hypothetical protein